VGITAPQGFRAAGVSAGLRRNGAPDVALVVNDGPDDAAAAVFTTNRFAAAPVTWSREALSDNRASAVVLNSGCANACTGPEGLRDTRVTADLVASELDVDATDVVVASTGLIGVRLPMGRLTAGVTAAAKELADDGGPDAARAIMTTDTVPKSTVQVRGGWTVGGMAKGGGMLAPSLATVLVVLTTDAVVPADLLQTALREATRVTFERIDSDGCMSTNDTVVVMASGASGITPSAEEVTEALTAAAGDLARQLLADGEGSTKDIAITVRNAASVDDALVAGRACARNNLLKTALYGNDPNWGRVLAAIGTTDVAFASDQVDVSINGITVCRGGAIGDPRDAVDLTGRAVAVDVDLKAGSEQATIWTSDLSVTYVDRTSNY
jgi:glutamate N-acetyltransferase / amino-acid N-acetyltransferase